MKAKESHSETQETRFDYDCSPHCSHLKFLSLFSCTRPPSSGTPNTKLPLQRDICLYRQYAGFLSIACQLLITTHYLRALK